MDFGSATKHVLGSKQLHYELAGNPQYASPEMLQYKGYNEKHDMWSCGVIFHKLLVDSFPFEAKTDLETCHVTQT